MLKTIKIISIIIVLLVSITACEKPEIEANENELITTVEIHLTEQGTTNTLVYKWQDLDGDGGLNPVIDDIVLAPGKIYNASIVLLDETKSPVENITMEVEEEAIDHRFYFEPDANSHIVIHDLNTDTNGVPLGTTSFWITGAAENAKMQITLRHYPNGGKESGDEVNDPKSSTDATVVFNTKVQ